MATTLATARVATRAAAAVATSTAAAAAAATLSSLRALIGRVDSGGGGGVRAGDRESATLPELLLAGARGDRLPHQRPTPAASAAGGLGASVVRPPDGAHEDTRGVGLSLSLRTHPTHSVDVWLDGERIAHAPYVGCPTDPTATFGESCAPCAACPGCPPCPPCQSQHECPLRPGREFVRFVVRLVAGTSTAPPTLQAHHRGLPLFPTPVPLPRHFQPNASWALALSAGTSAGHDDDHWVDNLRLTLPPDKPPPPSLVNATSRSLALSWFAPHHGGAPVLLYRLQRRTPAGWLTLYVGNRTERTVGPLRAGTPHLFRLQAYNAVGWGRYSDAGSFATATAPLTFDIKPPHGTNVGNSAVRCGGRLFAAGGQHIDAPAGVLGDGRSGGRRWLTTLEEYDTPSRSWLRRASMRTPRTHLGLACVRERTLLAMGGFGDVGEPPYDYEGPLTSAEEYDPATDAWYARADMPSARYHVTVASEPRGHVFVAGGFGSEFGHAAAAYGTERILPTFERFDPYTGQWVRKAPLPFAAYGLGLAVFDCARRCKVIAAGGYGTSNRLLASAAVYDPLVDAWRVAAPMPHPRLGMTMLASANRPVAYAIGGYATRLTPRAPSFYRDAAGASGAGTAARRRGSARRRRAPRTRRTPTRGRRTCPASSPSSSITSTPTRGGTCRRRAGGASPTPSTGATRPSSTRRRTQRPTT